MSEKIEITDKAEIELIMQHRKKSELEGTIKDLIDSGTMTYKELEEIALKFKPRTKRGRKPAKEQ